MSKAEKLEKFINSSYEKGFFNGAWLLCENGEITSEGALGYADLSGRKLNKDSVFDMASVSKQFTASGIMILWQRGLLDLDAPIKKYFPNSPYDPLITVRNLLNHTSGLPDYMSWVMKKSLAEGKICPMEVIEDFLYESGEPPAFSPGEKWEYCNTGYALLALLIKKISGKSYGDFLRDEIFRPAGMNHTSVYHRRLNRDQTIENYAYGMAWDNGEYKYPDDVDSRSYVVPLDGIEGDGSVNSNLHDMLLWDRTLRNGSILSMEAQEEMRKPARLNNGSEFHYGFGWMLDLDRTDGLRNIWHNGTWACYKTMFFRFLDSDSTLIYMLNREGLDDVADAMTRDGLVGTVLNKDVHVPEKAEVLREETPACDYSPLLGVYEGPGSDAEISLADDGRPQISLSLGGRQCSFEFVSAGNGVYYTVAGGIRFECDGNQIHKESIGTFIKRR